MSKKDISKFTPLQIARRERTLAYNKVVAARRRLANKMGIDTGGKENPKVDKKIAPELLAQWENAKAAVIKIESDLIEARLSGADMIPLSATDKKAIANVVSLGAGGKIDGSHFTFLAVRLESLAKQLRDLGEIEARAKRELEEVTGEIGQALKAAGGSR